MLQLCPRADKLVMLMLMLVLQVSTLLKARFALVI